MNLEQKQEPKCDTVSWTDKDGVKHFITYNGAVKILQQLYEDWPGTFEEIEAALNMRTEAQTQLQQELEKEKVRSAIYENDLHLAKEEISKLKTQLGEQGRDSRIMLNASIAENQSLRGRLLRFRNLAQTELSNPL